MKSINLLEEPSRVLTEDEIIYTLKNKDVLMKSINEKLCFIKQELNQNDEMIETASFHSPKITDMSCGHGTHKDLADVLLTYGKNIQNKRNEWLDVLTILIERKNRIERIWLCFLILEEPYYTYMKRLYVDGEKYFTVETESGFSRQVFAKYRKEALGLIEGFYFSTKNLLELSMQFQRKQVKENSIGNKRKNHRKVDKNSMGQITLYDFLSENK